MQPWHVLAALAGASAALGVAIVWRLRRRARPAAPSSPARELPGRPKAEGRSRKDMIKRYGARNITLAGDVVQSGPERRIADFLYKRGIRYVYEMQLAGATPDFYLPDFHIIVEHWGMDHAKYREKRMMKAKLYRARGFRLVETEKRDVPRLEAVLEARLRKVEPGIFDGQPR